MNQNRAQRYTTVILALLGLFLGSNVGVLVDQAAGLQFNAALWPAFQACGYCLQAGVPMLAAVVNVNRWTLLGALFGTAVGLVIAALLRWQRRVPDSQPRRLSSLRQAAEVARFSRALSDTLELPQILTRLHEEVMQVTGADCGSTFLLDPASPEHRVSLRVGEGTGLQRLSAMEVAAVSTGHSRIVQDFEAEGEAPPHVGVRSALLVLITHEGSAIGLIQLHSQQPAAFDGEFLEIVDVLAIQAAIAVQSAQRYDEQARRSDGLRQRVNQLQQLSQIPKAIRVDAPLTSNLQAIAQTMLETANFSLVLISVYDPARNELVHTASAGLAPKAFERLTQLTMPWERVQPFLREENRSNRVYRVPQSQTVDLYQALELVRPERQAEPRAPGQWHPDDMLLVPLYGSRGEIEGMLSVGAPQDKQTPASFVLEMLEIFASQAALAVENSQLLAQAEERVTESQERAVQLSTLTEAAGTIAAALRVDEVVALTLDQLRRVIAYDSATFWQRDLSDGEWQVLGARSYNDAGEYSAARAPQAQAAVFSEISATRSAVFVSDVSRDARFAAQEPSSLRSWLGVPLLSSGEVTGILSLEKSEDNFYGPSHVPLATSFANRVAVALDNARQFEESVLRAHELEAENSRRARDLESRSQRLAVFNRLAAGLSEARDLDSLLELALKTISQALGVEQARGIVLDPDTPRESARIMAASRLPTGSREPSVKLELSDDPLILHLQESAGPLMSNAADSGPESDIRTEHFQWIGEEIVSALFLPLLADGRLVGLLGFGATGGRRFLPADADLGWAVAQQTVTALQYLRVRERAQEQSIVQQIARSIGRAESYPELYAAVRTQLAELAGLRDFSLALYNDARDRVTFPLVVEGGQVIEKASEPEEIKPSNLLKHVLHTRQALRLEGDTAAAAKTAGFALASPGQHPVRGGEAPDSPAADAYLAEPLVVGEKLLGVLVAEERRPAEILDERTERILAASASQVALVVDSLRVKEQARQSLAASQTRASDFKSLGQAAQAISSSLRSQEVAATALQQAQRLLGFDRGSVWKREPGIEITWRLVAAQGVQYGASARTRSLEPDSPLGSVAAARQTLAIGDTSQDSRFEGAGRAWMGVPLVNQGEVIGLMELEKDQPGAYSSSRANLAQALGARIALALNNALQYEANLQEKQALEKEAQQLDRKSREAVARLEQAAREAATRYEHENTSTVTRLEQEKRLAVAPLEMLSRAATTLGGSLILADVITASLNRLTEAFDAERAALVVYDETGQQVIRAAQLPADGQTPRLPVPLADQPLLARLRENRTPLTLDELATDRPVAPEHTSWIGPMQSGLLIPLSIDGQIVGLAAIGADQPGRAVSEAELHLAQNLGQLISAAVYEARQHEALQQKLTARYEAVEDRLQEQVLVYQVSRALSRSLDLRQVLDSVRAQMDAWFGPAALTLALYDETRHEVSYPLVIIDGQPRTQPTGAPEGLVRYILETQQPLWLEGSLPDQLAALGLPDNAAPAARSLLAVPLITPERIAGALVLADPTRLPAFDARHERSLSTLAARSPSPSKMPACTSRPG